MPTFHSQCHCKTVQIQLEGNPQTSVMCHCSQCRSLSGADYSSWVFVPEHAVQISKGESSLKRYALNERSYILFCEKCGTKMLVSNGKHFQNMYALPLGTIQNASAEMAPQIQVYTKSRAAWVTLHETPQIAAVD